jgi:uncharacterized protein (TIGR02145 family)
MNISVEIKWCLDDFEQVYSAEIGPFESDTNIGTITITMENGTEVYGIVEDCDGNTPVSGYVATNDRAYFLDNGFFSFISCESSISITAYNTSDGWEAGGTSKNITLTGGSVNAGTLVACGGNSISYFTDSRDGQSYKIITIGTQTWFAENLNYQTGNSWCYDNDNGKCDIYGRLYDWQSALNACPAGWHLPSDNEWDILDGSLPRPNGDAGGMLKEAGLRHWNSPNTGGTNSSGFTALPGGTRALNEVDFVNLGKTGTWWSSTSYITIPNFAGSREMAYAGNWFSTGASAKDWPYSCRCIKD